MIKEKRKQDWFFAPWYQHNHAVVLPIEQTARWKEEIEREQKKRSKGKEQQIESKVDSDKGEWCYWCQCTNESAEKSSLFPRCRWMLQIQGRMSAALRGDWRGEARRWTGKGVLILARLWTPHLTLACTLALCVCVLITGKNGVKKKKQNKTWGSRSTQIDLIWHL